MTNNLLIFLCAILRFSGVVFGFVFSVGGAIVKLPAEIAPEIQTKMSALGKLLRFHVALALYT